MSKKASLHIGCSGWNYNHWKGPFYTRKSSSQAWFREYSAVFSTVEINNTFYRLPERSTFKKWREQAPKGFIYSVKANRFITHMKKLKDPEEPVERFLKCARILAGHLGPVLFQLPPHWSVNPERLDAFTGFLPENLQCVFEFRDSSWYDERIYGILEKKRIAMCLHDMRGSESPLILTGPLCYIRFHGTTGLYGGKYPAPTLKKWARFIKKALSEGRDVYAYFNNDAEANAPRDALRLIEEVKNLGTFLKGTHLK
ncbi:MAG: DUF72 domain-containing protein [Candidatus Omnitrophota bacterium]|nr:DUF72 domain-containing protein [Candidatus Omnitrophota bacterium]